MNGNTMTVMGMSFLVALVTLLAMVPDPHPARAESPDGELMVHRMGRRGMGGMGCGQGPCMMNRGGTMTRQPRPMMQGRMQMMNRMMQMRMQMQKDLEERLQAVEAASGDAKVDAIVDLLRTLVQQRGQMLQQMQAMHQQMHGMHMMMRGQQMMQQGQQMMDEGTTR